MTEAQRCGGYCTVDTVKPFISMCDYKIILLYNQSLVLLSSLNTLSNDVFPLTNT